MALGITRAGVIIALGWAAIIAALLPPQESHRRPVDFGEPPSPQQRREWLLSRSSAVETRALHALETRERLKAAAPAPRATSAAVWVNPAFERTTKTRALELAQGAWRSSRLDTASVPVVIAVDTAGLRYPGAEYFLPVAAGEPCIAHVLVQTRAGTTAASRRAMLSADQALNMLGPCALYAAYGMPGPFVQEWFLAGGVRLALATGSIGPRSVDPLPTPFNLVLRPDAPVDVIACHQGDIAQCAAFFRRARTGDPWYGQRTSRVPGWTNVDGLNPRDGGGTLLSDLANEKGRAAFAAFWQSAAPIDSAFATAFGQPVGVWTARWMRTHVPWQVLEVRTPSVMVTLALAGIFIVVGAGISARRQVGV